MTLLRLRRDGVACSDLGSEIVILDLDSSSFFSVADSAAIVVGALTAGASREHLIERLTETYDVQASEAAADVDAFLSDLRSRNLLCEETTR